MKAPRAAQSNVVPLRQDPTAGIPQPYVALAAAHMLKLGKQVFENQPENMQAVAPNAPSQ
jgi:hypothetical protein